LQRIIIDLYNGAYGPTLRIDTQEREELAFLMAMFKDLTTGAVQEVVVAEGEAFAASGLDALTLRLDERKTRGKRLKCAKAGGRVEYEWTLDSESWRDCLALTGRLFKDGEPAHQYLSLEGVDELLVELAYREPRPPAFQKK
jgi:hypothetical protein